MRVKRSPLEWATNWGARRRLLPPWGKPSHHPVFSSFPAPAVADRSFDTDYLGIRTQPEMLPPHWVSPPFEERPPYPPVDEEYLEWIDVLEAVCEAEGTFTMLEVGAGYARWAARGWIAARRRGLAARIGIVEADPQHVAWASSHLAFNSVPASDIRLYEVAVGAARGKTVFIVEMPPGYAGNNPKDWYGQALPETDDQGRSAPTTRQYYGRPLLDLPDSWGGIEVDIVSLDEILADYEYLDLVDFDIQGVEDKVIESSIDALTRKVRRLHIGTHSRAIDATVMRTLAAAGWTCIRAYPCLRWNRTEFGWIEFNDGVQTWINPKLERHSGR